MPSQSLDTYGYPQYPGGDGVVFSNVLGQLALISLNVQLRGRVEKEPDWKIFFEFQEAIFDMNFRV